MTDFDTMRDDYYEEFLKQNGEGGDTDFAKKSA